jgi:hypothetical protein
MEVSWRRDAKPFCLALDIDVAEASAAHQGRDFLNIVQREYPPNERRYGPTHCWH